MKKNKIAIIGLGYVGLPLAVEFGKKYTTVGYDINENRIKELRKGFDKTNEVTKAQINKSLNLVFLQGLQNENIIFHS